MGNLHLLNWLCAYLTCAVIFFLVCFTGAKEALQPEIDKEFESQVTGGMVFVITHLMVSLVWPMSVSDMVHGYFRARK